MSVELRFEFDRAHGQKLANAERLLRWLVQVYARTVTGLDVAFDGPQRILSAFIRLQKSRFSPRDLQRIQFWVARTGGRVRVGSDVPPAEWETLRRMLSRCDVRAVKVVPSDAIKTIAAIATAAGLDAERGSYAEDRPTLEVDIGGPGWDAVHWDDAKATLFMASPISPPVGDPVPVLFSARGLIRQAVEWARVVEVRPAEEAAPGKPAGFALALDTAPRELRREIARSSPKERFGNRAAPRFQCTRPIEATFRSRGADPRAPAGAVVEGLVENLSLGGAFVRTTAPAPVGAAIVLSSRLPTGVQFETKGVVAFAGARGMGIRFELDPTSMADLREALTYLAARPRRALVVDGDAARLLSVAAALVARGFDVVTAPSALEGLRTLSEESLSLGLLVTGLTLPGGSGAELVATIRQAGCEADLLVCVTAESPDAALEDRLRRGGADLVLASQLGSDEIALRLDTLLEERGRASRLQRVAPA